MNLDDDIAPKLNGVAVFSKLDTTNSFQEIPFEKHGLVTTFLISMGCYYFKRLPFGISSI